MEFVVHSTVVICFSTALSPTIDLVAKRIVSNTHDKIHMA